MSFSAFLFWPDLSSVKIFEKMWTTLAQFISCERVEEQKITRVRPREGHVAHVCKISASISQKRRGHLDFCA